MEWNRKYQKASLVIKVLFCERYKLQNQFISSVGHGQKSL